MRLRFLIIVGLVVSLFIGSVWAQSESEGAQPVPTATLSPRALVGIFQTLRVNYGLDLDSDAGFSSFPEISTFIQLFAQRYLGSDPHMPYSSQINIGFMGYDQFDRMARSFSEPIGFALYEYLYTMYDKYPVMASVGLRQDGFAIVYTRRCLSSICNTPQEYIQRYQGEALGIYVMYIPGNVEGDAASLALIQQTFPALSPLDLSPVTQQETEEGYVFSLRTTIPIYGVETPLSYYVGTLNIPRYTLVYAVVGVGNDAAPVMQSYLP